MRLGDNAELLTLLPPEVLNSPQPVVFILGDENGPDRVRRVLEHCAREASAASHPEMLPLKFKLHPVEHPFLPKKQRRADDGSRSPDGRPLEHLTELDGLLKTGWVPKHCDLLPAVTLLVLPFTQQATFAAYAAQEERICGTVERVRASVAAREGTRLMLVLLKRSTSANPAETAPAEPEPEPDDEPGAQATADSDSDEEEGGVGAAAAASASSPSSASTSAGGVGGDGSANEGAEENANEEDGVGGGGGDGGGGGGAGGSGGAEAAAAATAATTATTTANTTRPPSKSAASSLTSRGSSGGLPTSPEVFVIKVSELKKRCSLDSKMVVVLSEADLAVSASASASPSPLAIRLHKHSREFAHSYYLTQARRLKKWEKTLGKSTQQAFLVRYCFKVCVLSSMQLWLAG
jgi:hypothetical protein